ncbi:MAG: glycosyl hydrolase family 28 protein, partial [Bacteroidota bacterium]
KSNVNMYLESGAIVQGTDNPADFPSITDKGRSYTGALVQFLNLKNAKITGRGVLAQSGTAQRGKTDDHIRVCNMIGCDNCGVYDVIIRDSGGWNFRLVRCANILMKDFKIVNDWKLSNQDGVDPDSSVDIVVDGVFMYTSDDAIAVKGDEGLCHRVTVKNCVFWTIKSALKIGSDPQNGASDITFENNDVVHADRCLALYVKTGFIDGVNYINNRSEDIGGDANKMLIIFQVNATGASAVPYIRNVKVYNYTAYKFSPNNSTITGYDANHRVTDVEFRDLVIEGKLCLSAADARILTNRHTGNITFTTTSAVPPATPAPTPTPIKTATPIATPVATGTAAPAGRPILFSDGFEDGDASGWTTAGGTWSVTTDGSHVYLQEDMAIGNAQSSAGDIWTDQVVEAKVKVLSFNGADRLAGIFARYMDANNYYRLALRSSNKIQIRRCMGGKSTDLAAAEFTVETGTWYTLKLEVIGKTINGYVNGVLLVTATDDALVSGKAAVGTYYTSAEFDEMVVTAGNKK